MQAFPLAALLLARLAVAYDNGSPVKTPPLGWQTWCAAGPCGTDHCEDFQIRETAKVMADNMLSLGFQWIVLDDCWQPTRNANGTLVPKPEWFPNGMKPVIDYVHSLGLKFGLYTSVGTKTCVGGKPGSYGHYQQDAELFAGWEADYVKLDYCGQKCSEEGHKEFSAALNKTGRAMVLELCRGPYQSQDKWGYAPQIAQIWRATGDHHDSFSSTLDQLKHMENRSTWSGPFGWAYGDMMMTGGQGCKGYDIHTPQHCPAQTDNEYRTEVSLYSIVSSPMLIGTDIRNITPIMKETLLNKEVISINQDWQVEPGDVIPGGSCGSKAWVRKLSDGRLAVAIPNLGEAPADLSVCLSDVGWDEREAHIRDVWTLKDVGTKGGKYTRRVDTHDTLLVLVSKADGAMVV